MSDQEWSELCELWGTTGKELVELWGMSRERLLTFSFCEHLANCTIDNCPCCDCRMYEAIDNGLSPEVMERVVESCRVEKIRAQVLEMQNEARMKREECERIRERVALYQARKHLLDEA